MIGATFVLLGVILGMYACIRFVRNRLGISSKTVAPDALKIVGKRNLDQRKQLYVVEVGERYLLVGTAENSISLIDHISAEEFAGMTNPPPAKDGEEGGTVTNFTSVLAKARSLRDAPAKLEKARQAQDSHAEAN